MLLAGRLADHGDVDAVIAENAAEQRDVGKPRHVLEGQRLAREQARDHQGSAAFLAPLIGIVPFRRAPPMMRIRSMASLPRRKPPKQDRRKTANFASTPYLT